ncbi:MAG: hypothetical protein JO001_09450 [Alphaproteobacteria bacterium]|nr:hypothetical protein [Alphaproteobacteria bacterium]
MSPEAGLFFGLWLRKPLSIASVYPSSRFLADAFAGLTDLRRPGPVLELGAGTGSLTEGLLRAGCRPERLIILEREPALARVLRRSFRTVTVLEADATKIAGALAAHGVTRLATVVSSLPIKWFSLEAQRAVVLPCLDLLGPAGKFLQVTNGFVSPVATHSLGIAGMEARRVWRNLPPAQIWAYTRPASTVSRGS